MADRCYKVVRLSTLKKDMKKTNVEQKKRTKLNVKKKIDSPGDKKKFLNSFSAIEESFLRKLESSEDEQDTGYHESNYQGSCFICTSQKYVKQMIDITVN